MEHRRKTLDEEVKRPVLNHICVGGPPQRLITDPRKHRFNHCFPNIAEIRARSGDSLTRERGRGNLTGSVFLDRWNDGGIARDCRLAIPHTDRKVLVIQDVACISTPTNIC